MIRSMRDTQKTRNFNWRAGYKIKETSFIVVLHTEMGWAALEKRDFPPESGNVDTYGIGQQKLIQQSSRIIISDLFKESKKWATYAW